MSKELDAIRHDIPRNKNWAVEFMKQPESAHHIIPNHVHPEFEEFNMIYKNAQNQSEGILVIREFLFLCVTNKSK
jgi:hypothetical protein